MIRLHLFFASVALFSCSVHVHGKDLDVPDVARLITASYTALHTIQGSYRTCFPIAGNFPDRLPNNVRLVDEGLFVDDEYQWQEDQTTKARRLDGVFGFRHEGSWIYQPIQLGFDGSQGRNLNPGARNARQGPAGDWIWNTRTPLTLVGQGITIEPRRNLTDLLGEATLAPGSKELPSDIVLKIPVTDESQALEITVWIDALRGFLPRRIETRTPGDSMRWLELIVDDIREVVPGVWVPIRGRERVFSRSVSYGEGVSPEEFARLPAAEQNRLKPTRKVCEKLLGLGECTYLVDVDSLRINHPIESSAFVIQYPDGTQVWDDIRGDSFTAGEEASGLVSPATETGSAFWFRANIVLVVLLGAVIVLLKWLRIRRPSMT